MVDKKTKQKLIKELEKIGIVYFACMQAGVHRSTFYRWKKTDKQFRRLLTTATKLGRENISDIAEYALLQNVKAKKMDAIKYALSHNSRRYKPKSRKVTIEHSNSSDKIKKFEEQRIEHWNKISDAYKDVTELVRSLEEDSDDNTKKELNDIIENISIEKDE